MSNRQKKLRELKRFKDKKREMEEALEEYEAVVRRILNMCKGDGPKKMNRHIRSRFKEGLKHFKRSLSDTIEKIEEMEAEESLARPSNPVRVFPIPKKQRGKTKKDK